MGLFGSEYKKVYATQTTPLTPFYDVGNTLFGAIYQYQVIPSNFNSLIRNANENSIAGRLYIMAKQSAEGGKLAKTLGKADGTLIGDYVADNILKTYITDADVIISQDVDTIRPNIIAHDKLINEYNLRSEVVNYNGTKVTETLVTVDGKDYIFKECFLSQDNTIGMSYYTKHITGYYQGSAQWSYETFSKEIDATVYDPNDKYLYVSYSDVDDIIHYWFYNLKDNTYPTINLVLSKNTPVCYPTFVLRDGYNRIDKENPRLFKDTQKTLRRLNIPWEDVVAQTNADYSGMRSSERKRNEENNKEYKDNLGNVEEILLTFAVDITDNDQRVMQYLFSLFTHLHKVGTKNSKLEYNHDKLKQKFEWDSFTVKEVEGVRGQYHRYTCSGFKEQVTNPNYNPNNPPYGSGGGNQSPYITQRVLEICYQHGTNHYTKIRVINPKASSYNNGSWNTCSCPEFSNLKSFNKIKDLKAYKESIENSEDNDDDSHEFIIPIFPIIVRKYMGAIKGGELLSIGMRLVFHAYAKIKKKWYQTTWFTVLRMIIYAVIIVVSCIYGGPAGGATAGKVVSLIELILELVIYIVLKIVLKIICKVCHVSDSTYVILDTLLDCIFIYSVAGSSVSTSSSVGTASASTAALPSYVVQSMSYGTYGASVGASVASSASATAGAIATEIAGSITLQATTVFQLVRSITNMCLTKDFSFNAMVNAVGSIAFSMSNSYLAESGWLAQSCNTTLHLCMNPEFLDACASKDWTRMLQASAPYLMETYSVANMNGKPSTSIVDYIGGKQDYSILDAVQDLYGAYSSGEQLELQALSEQINAMNRKAEIQNQLFNYIMNKGRTEINYILMKKMQYTDDYEYIKFGMA